jgi:hypothetical protein
MIDAIAFSAALMPGNTLATSALPDAPVVVARRLAPKRQLRRSTAWRLRRIADHLAPA